VRAPGNACALRERGMSPLPGDRQHAPREIASADCAERVVDIARLRDAAELSPSLAPQPNADECAVPADDAAHARFLQELEDFVERSKAAVRGSSTAVGARSQMTVTRSEDDRRAPVD
jgi:hypothetical protein